MRLIAPEGYRDFQCIASRCRHTCCAGWEIDIDPETLATYLAMPGDMGDAIRRGLCETEDGAHFRLDEKERCPMLTQDGLCRLILHGGDGLLCQVCADHPRFRSFFSDRTEIGLGLCCEEAARLVLTRTEPFRLVELENDYTAEPLTEDEDWLLGFRALLFQILLDRGIPLTERLDRMISLSGLAMPEKTPQQWAAFLRTLEQLDSAWDAQLRLLQESTALPEPDPAYDQSLEQLGAYLLYRQLPGAMDDGMAEERVLLCVLLVRLVRQLQAQQPEPGMETLIELARLMSSELEYSDENISAILQAVSA